MYVCTNPKQLAIQTWSPSPAAWNGGRHGLQHVFHHFRRRVGRHWGRHQDDAQQLLHRLARQQNGGNHQPSVPRKNAKIAGSYRVGLISLFEEQMVLCNLYVTYMYSKRMWKYMEDTPCRYRVVRPLEVRANWNAILDPRKVHLRKPQGVGSIHLRSPS